MDELPCLGQTSELLQIFHATTNSNFFPGYVRLNGSWYVEFYSSSLFVELSSSAQLRQQVSSILLLKLRQRVSSILQRVCSTLQRAFSTPVIFPYLLCEKSLPSVGPFILHIPLRVPLFLYSALWSRTSSVSCTKSLRYTVDSGLRITLQLWNTVSHSNPVIMHCLTFWKE